MSASLPATQLFIGTCIEMIPKPWICSFIVLLYVVSTICTMIKWICSASLVLSASLVPVLRFLLTLHFSYWLSLSLLQSLVVLGNLQHINPLDNWTRHQGQQQRSSMYNKQQQTVTQFEYFVVATMFRYCQQTSGHRLTNKCKIECEYKREQNQQQMESNQK